MASRTSGDLSQPELTRELPIGVRAAFWIGLYLLVILTPLAVVLLADAPPGRGFVIDFSVALGFVGLALMGLEFALCARFKAASAPFGMDAVVQFHRQISYVALVLILAHPILLFLENSDTLKSLNVFDAPARSRLSVLSVVALLLLIATSIWRARLRISYEAWQVLHSILAVVCVAAALVHAILVGYYLNTDWKVGVWIVYSAALVWLLVWVRFVKPFQRYRRPWTVVRVQPEPDSTWTLVVAPEGHPGFTFMPGQYAWITVNRSPFTITNHPFSFSSSSERAPGELMLSIKARGDFTSTIKDVPEGARVYVDGPHGVLSCDRYQGPGYVFIGGRVGVTPLLSMLRTLADREDRRPCTLILASADFDSIAFREDIEELERRLDLTVVHVLRHPPPDWTGETGYVDAGTLERHLPDGYARLQYFVCGTQEFMNEMEKAIVAVGVPFVNVHTERFDMV
jgi:predicted ferric reductase